MGTQVAQLRRVFSKSGKGFEGAKAAVDKVLQAPLLLTKPSVVSILIRESSVASESSRSLYGKNVVRDEKLERCMGIII
jgi:hypothetical protein